MLLKKTLTCIIWTKFTRYYICIDNDFQGYKGFQIKIKQFFSSKLDQKGA
jgi:hypothetical protein